MCRMSFSRIIRGLHIKRVRQAEFKSRRCPIPAVSHQCPSVEPPEGCWEDSISMKLEGLEQV